MRFGETKIVKETFYAAKRPVKTWDINVDNLVFSKLIKTKTNFNYFTGYLDKVYKTISFNNAKNEWTREDI